MRKVRTGMMPPANAPRPDRATLDGLAAAVEATIDRAAAAAPNPGAPVLHRLNRTEYANAVRDLLDLPIDAAALLPGDDSSEGFDNMASVLGVSPALMQAYVSAAAKISRLAVGDPTISADLTTYLPPRGLSQAMHREGLPLGTRGGLLVQHVFPLDAEYEFRVGRGRRRALRTAAGRRRRRGRDHAERGARAAASDGRRRAAASGSRFPPARRRSASPSSAAPTRAASTTCSPSSRTRPACNSLAINGPLNPTGPGDTPSRRRIFSLSTRGACRRSPVRAADPVVARHARDAAAGEREGSDRRDAARVLRVGPHAARLRGRHPVRPRARARRSAVHLPVRAGAGRACAPARSTGSAISSWRRGCRSSCGAASRTRSCWGWRQRAASSDAAVLEQQTRRMLADPRAARAHRQPGRTVAATAAARRRRARHQGVRRQPPLRLPARDGAAVRDHRPRRSQHPGPRSTPTTRSSTSGWRATTASPTSAGAASGASRSPTARAAGCSVTAAS